MTKAFLWLLAIFAVFLYLSVLSYAPAHEAPSGWTYPMSCCSNSDCYRIPESEVRPAQGGGYRLVRTGEVFNQPGAPGLDPMARVFRWSEDGNFHRCSPSGKPEDEMSFCLFVPKPGV